MKCYNQLPFSQKIKWRIRLLWVIFIALIAYMIIISELGGGDSRIMTPLANLVSDIGLFGGMGYVLYRIHRNKKLLRSRSALREEQLREADERNRYLHDKSGGIVMDCLLLILLVVTVTAALFDMKVFYTTYGILCAGAALKAIAWFFYSRHT